MALMKNIWHIALAELRNCIQMFRTWILITVASSVCIVYWMILTHGYVRDSAGSPIAGVLGPRYVIIQFAQPIMLWFVFGIVFLAFDVRARDVRARMFEVLDVRPVSNLEAITGRLLGITLPLLVPAVLIVAWIWCYGWLAPALNWEMGAVVEPVSVLSFLTWDIVPNLLLWGSLTMLLSVILRHRVVIALVVLGILFFYSLLHAAMPLYLRTGLSTYTGVAFFASDLAPQFLSWDILINRTGVVILSSSFVLIAASLYPRLINPDTRPIWIGGGLSVFLVGALTLGGLGYSKIVDLQRVEQWAAVHKKHQPHQQTDVESITGSVEIRPGRTIKLDLKLDMAPRTDENLDTWLFSLNPGYRIDHIAVDDEVLNDNDYKFKDGLLHVPNLKTGDSGGTLHLVARGVPDPLFAYLDSALDWKTLEPTRAKRIWVLGQKPYVFHPQFVALLAGVSWFPTAGAAYGRDVFEIHKRDFFELNLEVLVPNDWIVAGPGTRQSLDVPNNGFRFNPSHPVPEFALIGSKFVRRAFESRGIEFELLLSPKHTKNLATLAPIVPALKDWTEKQIAQLQEGGVNFPFGTLSFVEVPTHLRVYGGGWKMGSAYAPPGIHMIRESGFPIAQFDRAIAEAEANAAEAQATATEDDHDPKGAYLFDYVKYYFQNDLHGSSPMISLGEHFLGYQTTPHGIGATALHAFVNELTGILALDAPGFFSIYLVLDADFYLQVMRANPAAYSTRNFIKMSRGARINRSRVWEPALRTALADLDFEGQPKVAGEVISLKSHAVVRTVSELFPQQKISALLSQLQSQHRGQSYSPEDFFEIARDSGIDFDMLVGNWLRSTDLAGFLVQEPILEKVVSSNEGEFEFQTSFVLRNDEPVPGAVAIEYHLEGERRGSGEGYWADTVHVSSNTALRVALHTSEPIDYVVLHPHLSFNQYEINLWNENEGSTVPLGTALPFVKEFDWVPVEDETRIVVDDLSEGFTIVNGREHHPLPDKPSLFDYFFGPTIFQADLFNPYMNHGLPSFREAMAFAERGELSLWLRTNRQTGYGRYLRTYTTNPMGTTEAQPQFAAKLPSTGRWKLEFHVPSTRLERYPTTWKGSFGLSTWYARRERDLGIHRFEIDIGSTTKATELDLSEAPSGWNELGIFETSSNEVSVTIVEVTDGVAIADAVRWTPVE